METEIAILKQYLLGNLTPQETEEIDLRILSDESLEEKLYRAENELAEDFLEGTLTPEETELFYKNFLVSAQRKEHLKEIALLKKYAGNAFNAQSSSKLTDESTAGFGQRLKNFFEVNFRPAAAVLTVLIICLAAGITWKLFFTNSNNELAQIEKEYERMNRQDLSNLSDYQKLSNVSLFSGTLRDLNRAKKLNHEELTENVFFRLELPFQAGAETTFNVQILKEQKTIFRQNRVKIYKNQSGQEIRLIAPKSVLQNGQYQIRLENDSLKDLSLTYGFTVE